jgi:Domain of unknown function (DUF4249)
MNKYLSAIILLTVLISTGCTEDTLVLPESDLVVLKGYLFANSAVTEIQLSSTLPLGSEDSLGPPISDADIRLIKDGNTYQLEPTTGREGYYNYPGNDLSVNTGDEFRIEVEYFGKTATAKTVVPSAPVGVDMNTDELLIEEFTFGRGFRPGMFGSDDDDTTSVKVIWDNEDNGTYYVTLENIEEDPEQIDLGLPFSRPRRIISIPISGDQYIVSQLSVTHLGEHKAKVYRVNQEYVDLYSSRQQDTRDLNEPLTNVVDGLGVFSAFNSDSVFFEVVED